MIINHNMGAINAQRNMGINSNAASKNMEKLSSGLKINRAGDNAAGLSISEKMRAQIRGLDQASTNSEDGISMIQTAEGALNETHSILQRMRELAVQAGNDTNASIDRTAIQEEINQLTSEINRIGNTTEFNTQKLLNGDKSNAVDVIKEASAGTTQPAVAASKEIVTGLKVEATGAGASGNSLKVVVQQGTGSDLDTSAVAAAGTLTITLGTDSTGGALTVTADDIASLSITGADAAKFKFVGGGSATVATLNANLENGADSVANVGATAGEFSFKFDPQAKTNVTIGSDIFVYDPASTTAANGAATDTTFKDIDTLVAAINNKYQAGDGYQAEKIGNGSVKLTQVGTEIGNDAPTVKGAADSSVKLQIGANENQAMSIEIGDMRAEALGITSTVANKDGFTTELKVTDGTNSETKEYALDVSSYKTAKSAITTIQEAIDKVSAQRSSLGAYQNRLEHTINNLDNSSENLTAAESRIRDTDMAKEMSEYSKNNILQQASQAMLAQAKSQPQQVLQLLQ